MIPRRSLPRNFDYARWQVERERCQLDAHLPQPPFKEAAKISEALDDALRKLGITYSAAENRIQAEWVAIVGPDFARHATPGALDKGVLAVYVMGSTWLAEIKRNGVRNLIARINAHCGETLVRDIALRAAPSGYKPRG